MTSDIALISFIHTSLVQICSNDRQMQRTKTRKKTICKTVRNEQTKYALQWSVERPQNMLNFEVFIAIQV